MTKKQLDNYFVELLQFLFEEKICIPGDAFDIHVRSLYKAADVIFMDSGSGDVQIPIYDFQKKEFGYLEVCAESQVIDTPPVFKDGECRMPAPVIIIKNMTDLQRLEWAAVHELVHFLSVGSYFQMSDGIYWHHFGLNQYFYTIEKDSFSTLQKKCNMCENELITDLITWKFLQRKDETVPAYAQLKHFYEELCGGENKTLVISDGGGGNLPCCIRKLMHAYFIGEKKYMF